MNNQIPSEELIAANKELSFQTGERGKRAAELRIANKELKFQNKEKEKRAEELILANAELIFQNEEKDKRASELLLVNRELAFQNAEKEKRAEELTVALGELAVSEEQILEVNKELEAFSYSVSHDLRAPLRAVNGYTKMLKEHLAGGLDKEAERLMNNIGRNAEKMGHLIDDLLLFSRIGRRDLQKTNISMQLLVTEVCNELEKEQPGRIIEFHIGKLLPAFADKTAIRQVWLNLVSNAIKYSRLKERSVIEISSREEENEIIYTITDNGVGFDMRYADKLFGVFQRLHSEEEFEGTGVGLALVQRILLKHGDRIWAESKVDQGASFYFTLHKS